MLRLRQKNYEDVLFQVHSHDPPLARPELQPADGAAGQLPRQDEGAGLAQPARVSFKDF